MRANFSELNGCFPEWSAVLYFWPWCAMFRASWDSGVKQGGCETFCKCLCRVMSSLATYGAPRAFWALWTFKCHLSADALAVYSVFISLTKLMEKLLIWKRTKDHEIPSLGASLLSTLETESELVFGVKHRALRLCDLGAGHEMKMVSVTQQGHIGIPQILTRYFLRWHWPVSSLLQQGSVC